MSVDFLLLTKSLDFHKYKTSYIKDLSKFEQKVEFLGNINVSQMEAFCKIQLELGESRFKKTLFSILD